MDQMSGLTLTLSDGMKWVLTASRCRWCATSRTVLSAHLPETFVPAKVAVVNGLSGTQPDSSGFLST
jgi:putative effector of murein hydrolase LrgA (UPF0299 family)